MKNAAIATSRATQTITVEEAPKAMPVSTPVAETISCEEANNFSAGNLTFSNSGTGACLIESTVAGQLSGTYDECGGTLTVTWTYTDDCDRTCATTQTITVEEAPQATPQNTPVAETISCEAANSFTAGSLTFSNGGTAACLIESTVAGQLSGTYDECGGTLTVTWTYTDDCDRTSMTTQTITVEEALEADGSPLANLQAVVRGWAESDPKG